MMTGNDLMEAAGLSPLPVPVPDSLEKAVGYNRESRYLELWWEPAGDEAVWSNGRTTATGEWQGFLAYVQHPKVAPHLEAFNLGSSDFPADHHLLVDLVERKAYVGDAAKVHTFMLDQAPRVQRGELFGLIADDLRQDYGPFDEPLERILDIDTWEEQTGAVDMGAIERAMREHQDVIETMIRELDAAPGRWQSRENDRGKDEPKERK